MTKNQLSFYVFIFLFFSSSTWAATQVNFFTWRKQEAPLWEYINENNLIPGVQVKMKTLRSASYVPHLLINLQNNTPDIFQLAPGASSLQTFVEHQFITPYPDSLNQMNPGALLASLSADNQLYGVPFALQVQSVMVNKKLVDKHNANKQPENLTEMEATFQQLKSAGITPLHIAGNVNWYLSQLLAEVMLSGVVPEEFAKELVAGNACFTEPEYEQIFVLLRSWMDKGFINSNVAVESYVGIANSMALGNSAMTIDGGWRTSPASDLFQVDKDFQFYFWSIAGDSNKVYALGDGTYQVNAKSTKRDAANKVLAFTATKQFAELFARYSKELPAYGSPIDIENPTLSTLSQKVADAYPVSLFNAYSLNKQEPSYRNLVIGGFKDLFTNKKSPEQISQDIQNGLNSWNYVGTNNCQ